ncbi:MAG TPA: hypothetical protein VF975_02625, partial [Thermoanaerobaculia bacterium]
MNRFARVALFILVAAASLDARVISYAPYTDRGAIPAVQNRLDRHFVLVEQVGTLVPLPIGISPPPFSGYPPSQVVLYDSKGLDEPRIIFPQDGSSAPVNSAIVREDEREVPAVLIQTTANFNGGNPSFQPIWLLSNDGGNSWIKVALPSTFVFFPNGADVGGPFARARFSNMLVGTREVPFVVAVSGAVFSVSNSGSVTQLTPPVMIDPPPPFNTVVMLMGSDREGKRFLVRTNSGIESVDLNGVHNSVMTAAVPNGLLEGWITPDGAAYIEQNVSPGNIVLWYAKNGTGTPVAAAWDGAPNVQPPINSSWVFFAVPTADYSGAWIIRRGGSRPTTLYLHTPSAGLVGQWQDVTAPEVEALHPAQLGTKVLIQVHRPRQTIDQLMFKDPALAVWHVGDSAPPKFFDELFLSETLAKGFVHLDVDKLESGDQFVFDSGIPSQGGPGVIFSPPPPSSAGGSDVVQEWGVVRASLQQKLVLPGVGHTAGAFGSNWATDVTLQNPSDAPTQVELRFLPNGASLQSCFLGAPPAPFCSDVTQLTLAAREVRLIPD